MVKHYNMAKFVNSLLEKSMYDPINRVQILELVSKYSKDDYYQLTITDADNIARFICFYYKLNLDDVKLIEKFTTKDSLIMQRIYYILIDILRFKPIELVPIFNKSRPTIQVNKDKYIDIIGIYKSEKNEINKLINELKNNGYKLENI